MTDARALIRDAIRACAVDPLRGFVWFDERIRVEQPENSDAESERKGFLVALGVHLYHRFYTPGGAVPLGPEAATSSTGEIRAFMTALAGAHRDRDRWDPGWAVVEGNADRLIVRKWDLDFTVRHEDCRTRDGAPASTGALVDVRVPAERWGEYPGFMLFEGRELPRSSARTDAATGLARLYLNLDEEGARHMIDRSAALDDAGVPFVLKVAARPDAYERCDPVVLFVRREDYARASGILVDAGERLQGRLRRGTPAFVEPLAPGVGVADDPPGGESFGKSRCRLLAEALVIGAELRASGIEARLEMVEEHFREAGISLDRPHLNPGSSDYDIESWKSWASR